MTRFIEVEMKKPEPVAWLFDNYEYFPINKKALQVRIDTRKKDGFDTAAEEKALEALQDVQ